MKKRFTLTLAFVLVLALAACGSGKAEPASTPVPTVETTGVPVAEPSDEPAAEPTPEPDVPGAGEEEEALRLFVEDFARSYFYGTAEEVSSYLTADYEGPVDSYSGDEPKDVTFRDISPIDGDENRCFTSVQFVAGDEDSYTYLSLELQKTGDSWRVSSYGLEK